MPTIAIVYASGNGHTAKLAAFIADGVRSVPASDAQLVDVSDGAFSDWDVLTRADAIVFGSPTYMGGVSAAFKAFMDASGDYWDKQPWSDKLAAGFTIGSRHSGDKLATLVHLALFAAQHGMVWIGQAIVGERPPASGLRQPNGDGSWLGLMAISHSDKTQMVSQADLVTAHAFGERIAMAARRWQK